MLSRHIGAAGRYGGFVVSSKPCCASGRRWHRATDAAEPGLSARRMSLRESDNIEMQEEDLFMSDPQIVCTQCSTPIKLTESLAAPLIAQTRKQFEQQLASKEADFDRREAVLRQTQQDLAKAREAVDEEVAKKLKAERASIAEAEARKARVALANELEQRDKQLAELQQILNTNNAKLAGAQQAQADVLRKQRELDDARRELDLNVEKKVQESLAAVHAKAKLDAEEGLKAKLSEKEQQVASMKIQIDDLRRKAEQGSQQLQGE